MNSQRKWAFERGNLWAMNLVDAAKPQQTLPPRVVASQVAAVFEEINSEVAGPLATAMGFSHPEVVLRRFAQARRCFAAWVDSRIVAYGWLTQGPQCVGELEREFQVRTDEAYIWDCATLPAYRGQYLYSKLLSYMVSKLYNEKIRRIWIGASADNHPSIRGFANAGFQPAIRLTYVRLFNIYYLWLTGYPTASKQLVSAARRVLVAKHERLFGPLVIGYHRENL